VKIALVSPYDFPYPGGVTNHVAHLRSEFSRLGHDVRILAPTSADEDALANSEFLKFGSVVPIPANGSIARITLSLRLSGRVKRALKEERFDLIHLHEPFTPALPITVLRHSETVNIATFHSSWDGRIARLYGNPLLRRFDRRIHGRIAVSRRAEEFANRHFPGTYEIIPNGIDVAAFGAAVAPFPWRSRKQTILFVGRLEPRKGFRYLLRAYAEIRQQRDDVQLKVVGAYSPAMRRRYEGIVAEARIPDVEFVGVVSPSDLARYYRSSDIFCAPSTGGESQGIVLLEAMASGLPIVASGIAGYQSVMTDGREGVFVEPKDASALVRALSDLLASPDLRARLGAAGPSQARRYAWDVIACRVLEYYAEVQARVHQRPAPDARPRPLRRYLRRLRALVSPAPRAS